MTFHKSNDPSPSPATASDVPKVGGEGASEGDGGRPKGRQPIIAVVICPGLGAHRVPEIAACLVGSGARVIPLVMRDADRFVGPATLCSITGEQALSEPFDGNALDTLRAADVIVLAPVATELLTQLANGDGHDPITAILDSAVGNIVAVAAMRPALWLLASTEESVRRLRERDRFEVVPPAAGHAKLLPNGAETMAEPELIARVALSRLESQDLSGARLVVTSGPTLEDIDPVRFLGNRSTGKMGFAVAERAAARGAVVKLIAGPVDLATPYGVQRMDVRSALAMQRAIADVLGTGLAAADALIMSAAVADYRPAETSITKIKRSGEAMTLELVPNPDLVAEIGHARSGRTPMLVGFAVETDTDEQMVIEGRRKLDKKKLDLIVVNRASDAFGRDDNRAILVERSASEPLGVLSKRDLADRILDRVSRYLGVWAHLNGEVVRIAKRCTASSRVGTWLARVNAPQVPMSTGTVVIAMR